MSDACSANGACFRLLVLVLSCLMCASGNVEHYVGSLRV